MAVAYTNDTKTNVSDPLMALMWAEFQPVGVVLEDKFQASRMRPNSAAGFSVSL